MGNCDIFFEDSVLRRIYTGPKDYGIKATFSEKQKHVDNLMETFFQFSAFVSLYPIKEGSSEFVNNLSRVIECVRSCDRLPYVHTKTKGRILNNYWMRFL